MSLKEWVQTHDNKADDLVKRYRSSKEIDATVLGLSEAGVKAVAYLLSTGQHEAACLAGNDIGDDGAKVLAEGIKNNRSCKSYYLNRNNLGPEGIQAIAQALRWNDVVFRINLAGNPVGLGGARALKELVCAQHNIKQLILDDCGLDEEVFEDLKELVTSRGKHGLASLSLWHNSMTRETRDDWQAAIQGHDTLIHVDLPEPVVNQELAKPERDFKGPSKDGNRLDYPLG